MIRALSLTIGVSLIGCVTPQPSQVQPGGSTFSAASSYSAPSYQPLSVAAAAPSPGELMVRADQVLQPFAIRSRDGNAKEHLQALQAAAAELEKRLQAATGGAASLAIVGARLEQGGGKAGPGDVRAVFDGEVILPLPAEASAWDRARLLFGIQEVAADVAANGLVKAQDESLDFSFAAPQPAVKDPEQFRAQLMERWAQRAKGFIQAAQTSGAPLAVVECGMPPRVQQRPISLERVALSLEPACRIDVVREGSAAAR